MPYDGVGWWSIFIWSVVMMLLGAGLYAAFFT